MAIPSFLQLTAVLMRVMGAAVFYECRSHACCCFFRLLLVLIVVFSEWCVVFSKGCISRLFYIIYIYVTYIFCLCFFPIVIHTRYILFITCVTYLVQQ